MKIAYRVVWGEWRKSFDLDKLFDNYHVNAVPTLSCLRWSETHSGIKVTLIWRPVLVKILTIKLHYKSVLIPLQQILWTSCIFLSSINNTFFSVLVIIFSNMSYFCFNYTNTFFIHTMNYFSVVLRIIFLMCIENYFFLRRRIIFRGIANLFLGLQCFAGLAVGVDWFESF